MLRRLAFSIARRSLSSSTSTVVLSDRGNGVLQLTLNRPAEHNSMNDLLIREMNATLNTVRETKGARALIIRADGKSFCAGADLKFFIQSAKSQTRDQICESSLELMSMLSNLNSLPIPTIALVQGPAFGGGVGIVSCCDIAGGVEGKAVFALSEVKLGMIPATISPYVVAAIGSRNARRYFVTAESFSATQAKELGLLHHVTDSLDALHQWGDTIVNHILKNGPNAVTQSKKLVEDVSNRPIDKTLMADTAERLVAVRTHPESAEGIQAFLDKRKANWVAQL